MLKKTSFNKNLVLAGSMVIVALAVVAVLLEVASYYVMVVNKTNFYLPKADADTIEKFRASKTFSYELGWEPDHPNAHGYRGAEKDISNAAIALFGDSYTKGHPEVEKSWAYLLETKLQQPVLNFGVGGYGTDQGYLRFSKRYLGKLHTPYVALFIMSENIARVMNRYRGFYKRRPSSTKPRFYIDHSGRITLLNNPIQSREDYALLSDRRFLEEIGKKDYWYNYYENLGLNEFAHFPYSYFLLKALPYYVSRGYKHRFGNFHEYQELYDHESATKILRYIIAEFVDAAEGSGSVPLVVFLPNWKDMTDYMASGETVYWKFYANFRERHHELTFDGLDFFIPYLGNGADISEFFRSRLDGHYNAYGEHVVSEGVFGLLKGIDEKYELLENGRSHR